MTKYDEVNTFLDEFKQKVKLRTDGVYIWPRKENREALLEIGIPAKRREEIIMELKVEDYYSGPTEDIDVKSPPYYEFGVHRHNKLIYIKISIGRFNCSPVCMSFHIAKHPINHPLR